MFPCLYEFGEVSKANESEPPPGAVGGYKSAKIWSGSYGLHAKGNQFFENLGAPPLPVDGFPGRALRAILDSSYNKNFLSNSNLN